MRNRIEPDRSRGPLLWTIQPLNPSQWRDAMIDVYQRAYRPIGRYCYLRRRDIKGYIKWLYRRCPEGLFGAVQSTSLLGWIAVDDDFINELGRPVGAVHELVVDPRVQHHGIGRALMIHALRWLHAHGCRRVELWVGIDNAPAQRFYRRLGFQPVSPAHGVWLKMVRILAPVTASGQNRSTSAILE